VTIDSQAEDDWGMDVFGPHLEHSVWIGFHQPPGTAEPAMLSLLALLALSLSKQGGLVLRQEDAIG